MKKMLRKVILLIIVLVGFAFIPSNNVEALSAEEKIYGYGVYLCYTDNPNGYYPVLGEITLEQFKTWSDIIHLGSVPAKSTESRLKATTTCKGAFEKAGKTASTSSVENKNKALENYGYVGKTVGECMSFSFQKTPLQNGKMSGSTETIRIQGLCSSNPGNVSGDNSWLDKNSDAKWPVGFTFQNNVFRMGLYDPSQKRLVYPNKLYPLSGSLSSLMDSINSDIKSHFSRNTNDGNTSDGNNFIYSDKHAYLPIGAEMVPAADNSTKSKFELENRTHAALKLLGIGSVSDLMFTKEEKYVLYSEYLNSIYGINASNVVCDKEASPGDNYVLGAFKIGGMYKACWANAYKNNGNTVNALGGNYFNGTQKTWQDLVRELYEDFKDQIGEVVPEETQDDAEAEEDGDADCQSSGAAGSLGWIVCPILDWMTNASEYMYNTWIKNLLSISPQLFNNGEDGTRGAWTTFQSFSNIIFVIILLVVIISQITGAGIDNYGIKKILPKLILAAILVNVSYFICQIAIDISNITGNSLQALFDGLPAAMPSSIEGIEINNAADGFVGVSLLVGLVGGVWTVFAGMELPIILLTLFSSAIGVVVSLFFLFIMLSVRQAIVVVLTVLSPIAVVLYVLPNSKQWFDRYLKMFGALLLLYPLCGLVVGGGNYVSKLLLSSGFVAQGLTAAFAAIVIGIAPIFLIPTLLRNSLNAIGGLGGRLSGISAGLSRGATRSVRDSDGYRAALSQAAKARNRALAGIDANGRPTRMGNLRARIARSPLGRLTGYQGLQSARIAQANKDRESDIQANAELGELSQRYDRAHGGSVDDAGYFKTALRDAVASGDQNRIFSVIEQMKRSNLQQSQMAKLTRNAFGGSALTNALGGQRQNFLNEFAKKYGGDFLRKDFEQAHWARSGGLAGRVAKDLGNKGDWANLMVDKDGNGNFAKNIGVDDLKDEDVASLSSDYLKSLMDGGQISREQAQRVWASNVNMDNTNRLILGAFGDLDRVPRLPALSKEQAQAALQGTSYVSNLDADSVSRYTVRSPEDVHIV